MKTTSHYVVLGLTGAFLAGCVAAPGGQRGPSASASGKSEPLPNLVVGESFHYDDGRSETVSEINGDVVTWSTSTGVSRTSYKNPVLPYLEWWGGSYIGRIETDANANSLWPLTPGMHERYWVIMHESSPGMGEKRYFQDWECMVDGAQNMSVPAGEFETRKVVCYRTYNGYLRQTRTYYYAPSLGYYVARHDESASSGTFDRRLVAHEFDTSVLSEGDRKSLVGKVQATLNKIPDGKSAIWHDANKQIAVRIVPVSTEKKNSQGLKCRSYDGVFSVGGKTLTNHRQACLGKNGVWSQA